MRGTLAAMKTPQWLKLSLRDLFWLILVVGMGLGWYRDTRRERDVRQFLSALDFLATYDPPHGIVTSLTRHGVEYRIDAEPVSTLPTDHESEDVSEMPGPN
jgi:hypothetical protein